MSINHTSTVSDINVELLHWTNGAPVMSVSGTGYDEPIHVSRLLAAGDTNTKLRKSGGKGFTTAGLSLAPWKLSGANLCPRATPACIAACLNATGLGGVFPMIQTARIAKAWLWTNHREWFVDTLSSELVRWERKAERVETHLACRLNVFSDVRWESYDIVDRFPRTSFYDYSKLVNRGSAVRPSAVRPNYWITFSRSESNQAECIDILRRLGNVAVVFHNPGSFSGNRSGKQILPKTWEGFEVLDGDTAGDLRFLDKRGRKAGKVIGLRLKSSNRAQRNAAIESGFSVPFVPNRR